MHWIGWVTTTLAAATPPPLVPPSNVPADTVTPGVWGFVITFAMVIAVVLLIIDMVRRTRRLSYRAAVREQLEAEQAQAEQAKAEQSKAPAKKSATRD